MDPTLYLARPRHGQPQSEDAFYADHGLAVLALTSLWLRRLRLWRAERRQRADTAAFVATPAKG